ncbi:MAG: tyrosine--tRNA ligase, partial [Bacteroidetes bacterium]
NLIEELRWRGLIHDIIPGTEELLEKEQVTGYVGFDPTADSLHVGNLVPITLLMHLQRAGHRPIALVGGATGMVGDPSGKSEERKLLSEEELQHNLEGIKKQLQKFLDFSEERALLLNNYDWFKDFRFLDFIRDVGKHITVNYMLSKDSVKKRLETGMSFTEFTYQLVQGYDFYYLYTHYDCKLQMGGSDQWGNITTGTELIRRKAGGEAFAFTAPLVTKADGGKFGKTEQGNVWLDPEKTSPYKFYQFWLNTSDEDAEKYIKIFTFIPREEIESLIDEHHAAPHLRILQKRLAEDLTVRIHSQEDYESAVAASRILFGKSTFEELNTISERNLLSVFEGVPKAEISKRDLEQGIPVVEFLSEKTGFLKSKGEARRALKENSIAINKQKVSEDKTVTADDLIRDKYI